MVAGVVPLQSANASPKLLVTSKQLAVFQEDEAVAVFAPFAVPHRMTAIVIQEVLVDRDDRALLFDGCVYRLRVFLARSEVFRRVYMVLRSEHMPKVAVAFV